MKFTLLAFALFLALPAYAGTPDISIPDADIALIKTTDYVEVKGTNDRGGNEDFSIHNAKAISQFVQLVTSERFTTAPKSLKPEFKSLSSYHVVMYSNDKPVFELQIIADSVLDIPNDPNYYVQSDRHSEILLAPLLRLR